MGLITNSDAASGDDMMAQINVTSLVDVMFCLLIAFMVASPLMSPDQAIEVEVPKARGLKISEEEFLYKVISVDATGQVFMGVIPLARDLEEMTEQIAANAQLKEDGMAFIQGDKKVAYDRILDVLVALKQAGVTQVGFVTNPRVKGLK